ncbi:MAG: hypothetical protein AAFU64_12360, partial [Bacteroidota bacterium]
MKTSTLWLCLLLLGFCAVPSFGQELSGPSKPSDKIVEVKYPEVYELANIILALTKYGLEDKWQVRKGFPYYEEMREYFRPFMKHPLLDSVNYSREKWQEYL